MTIEIDYARAVELVEAAMAQEGPEYVYEKVPHDIEEGMTICVNTKLDESGNVVGSCLVGRAYILAGVDPVQLHEGARKSGAGYTAFTLGIKLTRKAFDFLNNVQNQQDSQVPWGRAIESGKASAFMWNDTDDLNDPYEY